MTAVLIEHGGSNELPPNESGVYKAAFSRVPGPQLDAGAERGPHAGRLQGT